MLTSIDLNVKETCFVDKQDKQARRESTTDSSYQGGFETGETTHQTGG